MQDITVEGVISFAPPPTTSYRYVFHLKNDKLSIWMEDRTSKQQWYKYKSEVRWHLNSDPNRDVVFRRYKGRMAKADYVTSANVISDTSPMDYLKVCC